jgi:hypothetical protein
MKTIYECGIFMWLSNIFSSPKLKAEVSFVPRRGQNKENCFNMMCLHEKYLTIFLRPTVCKKLKITWKSRIKSVNSRSTGIGWGHNMGNHFTYYAYDYKGKMLKNLLKDGWFVSKIFFKFFSRPSTYIFFLEIKFQFHIVSILHSKSYEPI